MSFSLSMVNVSWRYIQKLFVLVWSSDYLPKLMAIKHLCTMHTKYFEKWLITILFFSNFHSIDYHSILFFLISFLMFVHFYFRLQLYGFQLISQICAPVLNVSKSIRALGPQWWIRSGRWGWVAIIGIMGNQSMGLWNGKSFLFQHILIFSFVVLSIQFQELVYVRVWITVSWFGKYNHLL